MKKNLILLILLIITLPNITSCKNGKKIEYDNYTSYIDVKYGNNKRQTLDLCLPKYKTGVVGLILMIHPGGWVAGDKEVFENDLIKWSSELGYVAASINYRYASKHSDIDEILDDVSLSLSKIKDIAIEHNISTDKVILYGGSAGAHISLLYGYLKKDTAPIKPVAILSLAGPTDLTDANYFKSENQYLNDIINMFSLVSGYKFNQNSISSALPYLAKISPINHIDEDSIPTIICQGALDDVVPLSNAVTLDEMLTKNKIEHELIIYPNSGHGLENDPELSYKTDQLLIEYAKKYL